MLKLGGLCNILQDIYTSLWLFRGLILSLLLLPPILAGAVQSGAEHFGQIRPIAELSRLGDFFKIFPEGLKSDDDVCRQTITNLITKLRNT